MKITKKQLRRIIREERARLLENKYDQLPQAGDPVEKARLKAQRDSARIPKDDRAFLKAMETIMDQLMILEPKARIQNAETLIDNLETVIDQAKQG